jgi:hypothetical protein
MGGENVTYLVKKLDVFDQAHHLAKKKPHDRDRDSDTWLKCDDMLAPSRAAQTDMG